MLHKCIKNCLSPADSNHPTVWKHEKNHYWFGFFLLYYIFQHYPRRGTVQHPQMSPGAVCWAWATLHTFTGNEGLLLQAGASGRTDIAKSIQVLNFLWFQAHKYLEKQRLNIMLGAWCHVTVNVMVHKMVLLSTTLPINFVGCFLPHRSIYQAKAWSKVSWPGKQCSVQPEMGQRWEEIVLSTAGGLS